MSNTVSEHEQCYFTGECQKYTECPMVIIQNLLSGKRKILILWALSQGTLRFGQIKKRLPDVSQKMLTQQLRSLEDDGLISRKVFPVVPPRVDYSLTDIGTLIIPLLESMHQFGAMYLEAKEN